MPPKELANEVLSAAVALSLGLPVPPPYLAYADPSRFEAINGPQLGQGRLVYASVDVAQPQVAMLCQERGVAAVLARLAKWQMLGRLYGFDALVANVDRHAGNILFSGKNEVWLIDHGYCFTGPSWGPADLSLPDRETPCRLTQWLTPSLSDEQRRTRAGEAAGIELDAMRIDVRDLASINHVASLLEDSDFEAVISFLSDRPPYVPRLASGALGIGALV